MKTEEDEEKEEEKMECGDLIAYEEEENVRGRREDERREGQ